MVSNWIEQTEYVAYRGHFILKVKKQFINDFDHWSWVPSVMVDDRVLLEATGLPTLEAAQQMCVKLAQRLRRDLDGEDTRDMKLTS